MQMAAKTSLEGGERTWLERGTVLLSYIYDKVAEKSVKLHWWYILGISLLAK